MDWILFFFFFFFFVFIYFYLSPHPVLLCFVWSSSNYVFYFFDFVNYLYLVYLPFSLTSIYSFKNKRICFTYCHSKLKTGEEFKHLEWVTSIFTWLILVSSGMRNHFYKDLHVKCIPKNTHAGYFHQYIVLRII